MQAFQICDSIACINNTPLQGNVYISLTVGIGFASRRIRVRENVIFIGAATANVYFNYVKALLKNKYALDVGVSVSMNATSLYWKATETTYADDIQTVINVLFSQTIDETFLTQEKQATMVRFKNQYKDLEFRARLKMMEFSHKNKDYTLKHFTEDLLHVTVKNVQKMREYLLFPQNLFLFIHGAVKKKTLKQLNVPKINQVPIQYVYRLEHYDFFQDEAFIKKSKEHYECGCLKFERGLTFEHLSKEFAVLTLVGEILYKGYFSIEVDHLDASIMYFEMPLRKYKHDVFTMLDRDNVEKAKMRFLKRFDQFIGQEPHAFTEMAGRLHFDKINIYEWYESLKELTTKEIQHFLQARNYKIREGYVHYYKEERRYDIV